MATVEFAFVACGADGKQTESEKRQIRSHCMRGRNKRGGSRRSLREARRAAGEEAERVRGSHPAAGTDAMAETQSFPELDISLVKSAINDFQTHPLLPLVEDIDLDEDFSTLSSEPPTLPYHPTIAKFADVVHKSSHEIISQVTTFNQLLSISYPAETFVDFGTAEKRLCDWIIGDKAYFHTILFANSAVSDFARGRALTKRSRFHLGMTLMLLNEKLSDCKEHVLDSTLYVILSLAAIASGLGDYAAVEAHLTALEYIVTRRGGLEELRKMPMLQFKLERMDLVSCLSVGGKQRFSCGPVAWHLPVAPTPASTGLASLIDSNPPFDPRFLAVFRELQLLTVDINSHYRGYMRLSGCVFQPTISSIQTRLLLLKEMLDGTPEECLILGMLAFLSTMFRVPCKKIAHDYLAHRLQSAYQTMPASTPELHTIQRWLLMMGSISVFDPNEPWVRASWDAAAGSDLSREEVLRDMRRVMWIECVHDEAGRKAYASMTRRHHK